MSDNHNIEPPAFNQGKDTISGWCKSIKYGVIPLFVVIGFSIVINRPGDPPIAALFGGAFVGLMAGTFVGLLVWLILKRVIQSDYDACMRCLTSEPDKLKENDDAKVFAGKKLWSLAESSNEALHAIVYLLSNNWVPLDSVRTILGAVEASPDRFTPYAKHLIRFLNSADSTIKTAAENALKAVAGERIASNPELWRRWLQEQKDLQ